MIVFGLQILELPYLLKGGFVSNLNVEHEAAEVTLGHHRDTGLIFSGAEFLPPPWKSRGGSG